jgi:hypothetical protein
MSTPISFPDFNSSELGNISSYSSVVDVHVNNQPLDLSIRPSRDEKSRNKSEAEIHKLSSTSNVAGTSYSHRSSPYQCLFKPDTNSSNSKILSSLLSRTDSSVNNKVPTLNPEIFPRKISSTSDHQHSRLTLSTSSRSPTTLPNFKKNCPAPEHLFNSQNENQRSYNEALNDQFLTQGRNLNRHDYESEYNQMDIEISKSNENSSFISHENDLFSIALASSRKIENKPIPAICPPKVRKKSRNDIFPIKMETKLSESVAFQTNKQKHKNAPYSVNRSLNSQHQRNQICVADSSTSPEQNLLSNCLTLTSHDSDFPIPFPKRQLERSSSVDSTTILTSCVVSDHNPQPPQPSTSQHFVYNPSTNTESNNDAINNATTAIMMDNKITENMIKRSSFSTRNNFAITSSSSSSLDRDESFTKMNALDFCITKVLMERSIDPPTTGKPCSVDYICMANGEKRIRFRLVDLIELQVEQSLKA